MKSHLCTGCGQPHLVPDARKLTMDKSKEIMLRRAADHVKGTMRNDFMVSDFTVPEEFKRYNAFATLRYFGLVTQIKVDGKKFRNRWLITRNGWGFLRGGTSIHEFVTVRDNQIVTRSEGMVSMKDIYYKPDYIATTFEYFDDDGQPVGWRPLNPPAKQEQQALLDVPVTPARRVMM